MIKKYWKRILCFCLGLFIAFGIAACNQISQQQSSKTPHQKTTPKPTVKLQNLPEVAPLLPATKPNWISKISPAGEAKPLNQIRIQFKDPVIPVEDLDGPNQKAKLKYFEIKPALPGEFRFLTPRLVGFQPSQALPKATRIQVTIKAGLSDLKNHALDQDFAWTFNTEPIKLSNLPISKKTNEDPVFFDVKPKLKFTSNVELNLESLEKYLKITSKDDAISVKVELDTDAKEKDQGEENTPAEKFDPSNVIWHYQATPDQELNKGTDYRFQVNPGLRPISGNLVSEKPFVSQFQTYDKLALKGLEFYGKPDAGGSYGRFDQGVAQLKFNNGIVAESALENVKITPAPKDGLKAIQAYDNSQFVSLNPWALEPNQDYTITVDKNLKDRYGQTLDSPVELKYNTGDVAGNIFVPWGLNIFPPNKNLQLNISAVNLPEGKYKAAYKPVQPTDLVYYNSAYPQENKTGLLPESGEWKSYPIKGKKNEPVDVEVPVVEQLNKPTGMLAYGVKANTNKYIENSQSKWREYSEYGLVQLTNLGVFAQWFPESGIVKVNHLSDGSPVAANIEIYLSQLEAKERSKPNPCAVGKTDNSGTWLLNSQDLKQCMGGKNRFNKPPELLVIAKENQDWAFARTEEYSGAYGYDIDAGWDEEKPLSRGVIFSDRQLYQPGEKIALTGVASYLERGEIKLDKNSSYKVSLENPNKEIVDLGSPKTNEFGTFDLQFNLQKNQPLGFYNVKAINNKGLEVTGQFRIAEFKPPNFKVDLKLDQEFAVKNDRILANAESSYLFGAPVQSGKIKYYVTRRQTEFNPQGWEKFRFGRQWFWPEEAPQISSDVLQENSQLDSSGKASQTVSISDDLPYPMTYRIDAEVSDVSNLSVADSQTFIALPNDKLIGLETDFVANANKAFNVNLIVTDHKGNAIKGEKILLELQKMDYSSVTEVVEGSRKPRNQIEYKTVNQTEVFSGEKPVIANLTAPESGSYRIRANFANSSTENTATDLQIWASGDNAVNWGYGAGRNQLKIKLDKATYQPGETATALIQSPYPEGELYFAIVRDKTLYQTITKVQGGAPQIKFTVTPEMLPNAAVEAVLVRQGKPLEQVEPGSLENIAQIGLTPFKVDLGSKYLQVQIIPENDKLAPKSEAKINLQIQDKEGKPVKGQVTLMAVNEAVLQLTGYRPPNLVDTVYSPQSISTRFSDNREDVKLQNMASPIAKGWGFGGGFSTGAGNTRIREDFQPLAYYNPSVITDNNGKATVQFTLPDDLTTWRLIAIANDGNLRFGNGENSLISTKPVMANPVLPQFARVGDKLTAGLSVTNNTKEKGDLEIKGEITGSLALADQGKNKLKTQAQIGTSAYRFPMLATKSGDAKIEFTSQLNKSENDGFAVNIPVKQLMVTENVVETGTTEDEVKIPLNVNQNVVPDAGGLEISLASTLIPEITAPAKQVFNSEQLPFLEPVASQLSIAANLRLLSKKYGQAFAEFNPKQQADQALEQLAKLQKPDGGFGYYPKSNNTDAFTTAYTAEVLAQADRAFPNAVNSEMIKQVKNYLRKVIADPGQYDFCKDNLCKNQLRLAGLMGLAELGDKSNEFLSDIYAARADYDPVTQLKLARYLAEFPQWQDEAKSLLKQWEKDITETGRNATVNLPPNWIWLNSPISTQAQALRLFVAQKADGESIDKLLESLLSLRRNGTWQTTYDNAEALTALVAYSQTQTTPPNFTANVNLAGKNLDSVKFAGYDNPNWFLSIGMDQLPRKESELILSKNGKGKMHYLVDYSYRLPGDQPGRFNGLRIGREIRFANQSDLLARIDLAKPSEPLTVAPGEIFDIGLEIITDRPVDRVVITDPLPAGFEAVDTSFKTATNAVQAVTDSWQIDYQNIYRDRIVAYAERLEPGVYSLHYLVRSVTPGTYQWPGAEAKLQYAAEEFGRSASSTLIVKE